MMALAALVGAGLCRRRRSSGHRLASGAACTWTSPTFDNDNRGTPNKDDTEIRRAWLDVSVKFFVVDYKLEADFSGDRVEAKDVYLGTQLQQGRQADRRPVQAVLLAG
ncbi:MAG: porin [Stenotrophomonas sp.]